MQNYKMSQTNVIAYCLFGVSISLLIVGLVSGTFAHHIIQIIPMLIVAVTMRRTNDYGLALGLSLLVFWLFIMIFIWMFLLGIARIVTGHYSLAEIILTIIMALISSFGIIKILRSNFRANRFLLLIIFIAGLVIQYGFVILSYRLPL